MHLSATIPAGHKKGSSEIHFLLDEFFFYLYTTVNSENFSDYTLLWAHWKYSYLRRHAFEFLLLLGRWGLCPEDKYKNMFSGKNVFISNN